MSSDDSVEDPRKDLMRENEERIKALEIRSAEIDDSLQRKDLSPAVADALIEEYVNLREEYWSLSADQGYLRI